MKIKPTLVGHKNPECANSFHENQPNRILNRFLELNSVENKMQLESKSSSRKRQLRPEQYFFKFVKSRAPVSFNSSLWINGNTEN